MKKQNYDSVEKGIIDTMNSVAANFTVLLAAISSYLISSNKYFIVPLIFIVISHIISYVFSEIISCINDEKIKYLTNKVFNSIIFYINLFCMFIFLAILIWVFYK